MNILLTTGVGLFVLLLSCSSSPAQASIVYVDAAVVGGANNGSSWADAFSEVYEALNVAIVGDEIWAAMGTYTPPDAGRATILTFRPGIAVVCKAVPLDHLGGAV